MDNSQLSTQSYTLSIWFRASFALNMGWITLTDRGGYVLGPDLKEELYTDERPTPHDIRSRSMFWYVDNDD